MKRILSLALVLVMVLGMIPMALANTTTPPEGGDTTPPAGEATPEVTVSPATSTIMKGEETDVSLSIPTGYELSGTPNWSASPEVSEDGETATYPGIDVNLNGHNLSVSGTIVKSDDETVTHSFTANFVIKVLPVPSGVTISGDDTVTTGEEATYTATVAPDGAPDGVTWDIKEDTTDAAITSSGKFKATKAGTYTIVATSTKAEVSGEKTVTVEDPALTDITFEVDPTTVELKVGEDKTVDVVYSAAIPDDVRVTEIWVSKNTKIATVGSTTGKITAVAEGSTEVEVEVKIGDLAAVKKTVTVNVTDGAYIKCDNASVKIGETVKLAPTVIGVPSDATVYFSYSESSDLITKNDASDASYTRVAGNSVGVAAVTIDAYYVPYQGKASTDKVDLDAITVYVGVYDDHTVEVTLKSDVSSTIKFTDENVFSSAKYDGNVMNSNKSLQYLLTEPDGYKIAFSESASSDNIGSWQTDQWGDNDAIAITALNGASIKLNGKQGTMVLKYTITTASTKGSVIVATGTLKITAGETVADITYKTGFNTSISVKEEDFFEFYESAKKRDTLDYVVFHIDSDAPAEGTLYTTDKELTKAKSDMKFFYRYTNSDNGYDLAELTYDPKLKTKEYVDYVEFTCYGTSKNQVTGILAFEVGNENPFTDVKENMYYYDAVLWAVGEGITNGISDTKFGPDNACTRGQVVTFLWRAAGEPEPESSYCKFTDVKRGSYYYDAVLWAVEEGITDGMTATTFAPDAACTRAQVVTFLYRFFDEPSATSVNGFKDVPNNAYYYKPVVWAVKNGITNGQTKDTFAPNTTCTRGQIVTFLYRAFVD